MSASNSNKKNHDILYYIFCIFVFEISPVVGLLMFFIRFIPRYIEKNNKKRNEQNRAYQQVWSQSDGTQYDEGNHPLGQLNHSLRRRLTNPFLGMLAQISGALFTVLFASVVVSTVADDFWMITYGFSSGRLAYFLGELVMPAFLTGLSSYLFYWGHNRTKKAKRTREYVSFIGDADQINLQQLSNITGIPYKKVVEDISELAAIGLFGRGAYIDLSTQYLILNSRGKAAVQQEVENAQRIREQQKDVRESAVDTAPDFKEDDILYQIRKVNDDINDKKLSDQIDRIEEITRLILRYQKEHPDQSSQLHSFLSYYLPTTLKILNAYAELERQSIQGMNITETRRQIEATMEKVVTGFEKQLDQLFASNRMDISSEIQVLENMMQQDGLTAAQEDPFGQVRRQV